MDEQWVGRLTYRLLKQFRSHETHKVGTKHIPRGCGLRKEQEVHMKEKKGKESTISGIVVPNEWDDNDNVTRVAIQTENDEEYTVEYNPKGKELLRLLDHEVEVKGVVRQTPDGDMIISVKKYESLGEYDEDELGKDDEDEEDDKLEEDEW